MSVVIAEETIYAAALVRHSQETLATLYERVVALGPVLLSKGYAQDADGGACLSNDPCAVRWSAYGLYERVLRERFPTEPVYRLHMHDCVGSVMSNAIGLSAEFHLNYNPDAAGPQRINRGMDWLIYEAPTCKNRDEVLETSVMMLDSVPPERALEAVIGKPCLSWTPNKFPQGARLVKVKPEMT